MKENKKKKEKIKVESAQSDTESTEKVEETASSQQTEQSVDDFETKFNDVNDKYLRLMAEFDNYRKRMMKEKSDWIKTSSERILIDILPIIDNFERSLKAMENAENVAALKEGVDLIYSQMMTFLKQNGVNVVATENEPFDMNIHEAVTTIPAPTEEQKGKIIDCVQRLPTLR